MSQEGYGRGNECTVKTNTKSMFLLFMYFVFYAFSFMFVLEFSEMFVQETSPNQ